jgi:hypothetical protein
VTGSTYTEASAPRLGGVDPAALAEAEAAHTAGLRAREELQANYHENILGLGANAGDPRPAESSQQPVVPPEANKGTAEL